MTRSSPGKKCLAQGAEKRDSLIDMAREVDFLSLHMALTDATRHLIDETILRAMKPGAYLINCARGEVVDEKALIKALQNKWIRGAATGRLGRGTDQLQKSSAEYVERDYNSAHRWHNRAILSPKRRRDS